MSVVTQPGGDGHTSPKMKRCNNFLCCCLGPDDPTPTPPSPVPEVPRPTSLDVERWKSSFDRLLHCTVGRKHFQEFLKSEYSEENLLFWLACEDLKEASENDIHYKTKIIFDKFISTSSPSEVSLDGRMRDEVIRNLIEPDRNIYDEAQRHVYMLMRYDCYPRFMKHVTQRFVNA